MRAYVSVWQRVSQSVCMHVCVCGGLSLGRVPGARPVLRFADVGLLMGSLPERQGLLPGLLPSGWVSDQAVLQWRQPYGTGLMYCRDPWCLLLCCLPKSCPNTHYKATQCSHRKQWRHQLDYIRNTVSCIQIFSVSFWRVNYRRIVPHIQGLQNNRKPFTGIRQLSDCIGASPCLRGRSDPCNQQWETLGSCHYCYWSLHGPVYTALHTPESIPTHCSTVDMGVVVSYGWAKYWILCISQEKN